MKRRYIPTLLLFVVAMWPFGTALLADETSSTGYYTEDLELSDAELGDITSQVMAEYPMLSSSPGVKAAGATRHFNKFEFDLDDAWVIFHPHTETAGIKQAYQVSCSRHVPDTDWDCDDVRIRRYLTLETQSFEVRMSGPIESDAALALIEATRRALPSELEDGSATPETAINLIPKADGSSYLVVWGELEGYGTIMMEAHVLDGADASVPEGWLASVFTSDQ